MNQVSFPCNRSEVCIKRPSEHLFCPLCLDIFYEPLQCPSGHTFCRVCIMQALNKRALCPIRCSDVALHPHMLITNRLASDMIDDLDVKCPSAVRSTESRPQKLLRVSECSNGASGTDYTDPLDHCQWLGKFGDLNNHMQKCIQVSDTCPNEGCGLVIKRLEIDKHLKSCDYRTVLCELCRLGYQAVNADRHDAVCLERTVVCPSGCMTDGNPTVLFRRELETHKRNCSHEVVACQYSSLGCPVRLRREDIESHVADTSAHHYYLLQTVLSQQQLIGSLMQRISRSASVTVDMVFRIPSFNLSRTYHSHRQRISDFEFFLTFRPASALYHAVYLVFPDLTQSIVCRSTCSLCKSDPNSPSHTRTSLPSEYSPVVFFKSFNEFILSDDILTGGYVSDDGSITLTETITLL